MTTQRAAAPEDEGNDRILALSDAVFAFAMTLLVVTINVPSAATTPAVAEPLLPLQHRLSAVPDGPARRVSDAVHGDLLCGEHGGLLAAARRTLVLRQPRPAAGA